MRSLPLDSIEEKALSYQIASAVAYKYANVFVYAPEQRKDAQDIHRVTSAAARRYLWAAIDRKAEYRAMDAVLMEDDSYISAYVEPLSAAQRHAYLTGDWNDHDNEDDRGSTP